MPILESSKRTLRYQQRRYTINQRIRKAYKDAIKAMRQEPNAKNLRIAFSELDKAAKKGVIHPNKASRLKARLSSLIP